MRLSVPQSVIAMAVILSMTVALVLDKLEQTNYLALLGSIFLYVFGLANGRKDTATKLEDRVAQMERDLSEARSKAEVADAKASVAVGTTPTV